MVETGHKFHDNLAKRIVWAHWFTFFNIVAISLIGLRYIAYSGLADSPLGIIYQFISLIGHFSFLSAIVFGVLLFPFAFIINNNKLYRLLTILITTFGITFLIVDTQIFRLYNFHLNPLIWRFLQEPEQVEAIYSINLHYISVPIIFFSEVFFSWLMWRKVRNLNAKHIGRPVALFLFSMFALSHLMFVWADATQYRPITLQKSIYPLSYPMTARSFLMKRGWLHEDEKQKNELDFSINKRSQLHYPTEVLTFMDQSTNNEANILIINVDALRADMLNPVNMPNLQALANQGLNFKNHFSGSNNSKQGIYSLFYALPNSYWSTITENHISPVLMDKISEQNRPIGLFSGVGLIKPEFLQSSFSQLKVMSNVLYAKTQNNTQVIQQWNKWAAKQTKNQPWFSYIYLKQNNSKAFEHNEKRNIAEQSKVLNLYQSQITAIDSQIKELITTLKKQKQFNNTVIIVTGTHGQTFKESTDNNSLINGSHVPMVVILPTKSPQIFHKITNHVDLVPTLMEEVFSVKNDYKTYSAGQSLLSENKRQYVLSGDLDNYIVYEDFDITHFSRNGDIQNFDWEGSRIEDKHDENITLLIDVISTLQRFNKK